MRKIWFIFMILICNLLYADTYQELMKQGKKYFTEHNSEFKKIGQGYKFDETIKIFTKVCEANNAKKAYRVKACENLMTIYAGNGVIDTGAKGSKKYKRIIELQDNEKKIKYAKMACDLDSAYGCIALGNYYKKGDSVEIDLDKTTQFYTKACELNTKQAVICVNLGIHYEYTIKDIESALKVYKKVCEKDKKDTYRCFNYNRLREELE